MRFEFTREELQAQKPYTQQELDQSKGHVYTIDESWDDTVAAVVPACMAEQFNYPFLDSNIAWGWMIQAREMHPQGKNWKVDPEQANECASAIYKLLADTPINDNEEIDTDFLHFDKGTDRTTIWDWIELEFGTSIAQLEGLA